MLGNILITLVILSLLFLIALRILREQGLPVAVPVRGLGRFLYGIPQSQECENDSQIPMLKIFLQGLGMRGAVFLISLCWVTLQSQEKLSLSQALESLCHWDSVHYINLSQIGYEGYVEEGKHLFLVFYPGYVWILRLVNQVIPNTVGAGILLSSLCYSWGCCWVYRVGRLYFSHRVAKDGALLLSLFPFSFFFGSVMTEGLFLLATSASCYYACRGKWLLFGLWGFLASVTRMTGILVLIPAVVQLFTYFQPFSRSFKESLSRGGRSTLTALPGLLFPFLGVIVYMNLNVIVDGDPLAFLTHQEHWYQKGMWISQVLQYLWRYLLSTWGQADAVAIWLPEVVLFAGFFLQLALSVLGDRCCPGGLLAYGFCYLVANYSLSWLLSAGRYLSCGFVFFLFSSHVLECHSTLRRGIFVLEALFFGIYLCAYLSGAPVM